MPLTLTAKEYDDLWMADAPKRKDMEHRQNYLKGKHAILNREEMYADGTLKKNRVANWVRYIVNRYVGLLTTTPYQVTSADEESENAGPKAYTEIARAQDLVRIDATHLEQSFVKGYSVEVHGWKEATKAQTITAHDPLEWTFAVDDLERVVCAIRKIKIPAKTIRDGKPIADPVDVLTVYDDTAIYAFEKTDKANSEWVEVRPPTAHFFGRVPVIRMAVNDKMETMVSDALIGLCDEYNEIFSTAGDDVRREVDSLLMMIGFDPDWILKNIQKIRQERVLPGAEGVDAKYLTRASDIVPKKDHLANTRDVIHMTGEVPDVALIVGATGDTSGIALQLKFMPMMQNATGMIPYIQSGVRERIELINARFAKTSKPPIENVNVIVQISLPVNRIEEWSNIKSLDGVVSHRKQLELLSDVGDPEQELRRMEREADTNAATIRTPEEAAAVMDARVEKSAVAAEGDFETLVAMLSTALVDYMTANGVLDRAAAESASA